MYNKNVDNKTGTKIYSYQNGLLGKISYLKDSNWERDKAKTIIKTKLKNNSLKGSYNPSFKNNNNNNLFNSQVLESNKKKLKKTEEKNNLKKSSINYYNNQINNRTIKTERGKREKEKEEKERKEKEKKDKIERDRKEKEEKERLERLNKEREEKEKLEKLRKEKDEKEKLNKLKKELEKKEKEEKDRKEKEKKEREEKEKKEKKEREEKEEKERKEKERIEKEKNDKKNKEILKSIREQEKSETKEVNTKSEISDIITSKIGLRNLGNTCFMNTCLQNLIHSEYFIKKLFAKSFLLTSKTEISKQFYSLCNEVASCKSYACSPSDFKYAFGSKHSMFSGYRQHDTQEFCRILLEDMNSELNEVLHPAPYKELNTLNKSKIECDKEFDEVFRKRENSLIMDVFYGQLINIFKCDCNFETYSFEKILDLPLLLKERRASIDISDLLKDYFEEERIKFETKCENCKKKEWHTKKIKISQPPNILILSLQRQNPRTGTKNTSYVNFSDELNLSDYLDHECWNKNDAKYSLYGIGNHSGSIDFGHYYAYIKINNSWYEFNDSSVSSYSEGSRSSSTAYVLFYKKINA